MPLVKIPGYGKVYFPDTMTQAEIDEAIRTKAYLKPGAITDPSSFASPEPAPQPVPQTEQDGLGVLGWTGETAKAIGRGVAAGTVDTLSGIGQLLLNPVGMVASAIGDEKALAGYKKASDWITQQRNRALDIQALQADPRAAGNAALGLVEGASAFLPMMVPGGMLAKGAGALGRATGALYGIMSGAGMMAQEQAARAAEAGATPQQQALATAGGAALGAFMPKATGLAGSIAMQSPFLRSMMGKVLSKEAIGTLGKMEKWATTPLWKEIPKEYLHSAGILGALSGGQEALAGMLYDPNVTAASIAQAATHGGLHGGAAATLANLTGLPGTTMARRRLAQENLTRLRNAQKARESMAEPIDIREMGLREEDYNYAGGNVRRGEPLGEQAAPQAERPVQEQVRAEQQRPQISSGEAYYVTPGGIVDRKSSLPLLEAPEPKELVPYRKQAPVGQEPRSERLLEGSRFYVTPGGIVGYGPSLPLLEAPQSGPTKRAIRLPGVEESSTPYYVTPGGIVGESPDVPRLPAPEQRAQKRQAQPQKPRLITVAPWGDATVQPMPEVGAIPTPRRVGGDKPLGEIPAPIERRGLFAIRQPEKPEKPERTPEELAYDEAYARLHDRPDRATKKAREGAISFAKEAGEFIENYGFPDVGFALVKRLGREMDPTSAVTPEGKSFFRVYFDNDAALERLLDPKYSRERDQRMADVAEELAHVLQNLNVLDKKEWSALEAYSRKHKLLTKEEEEAYKKHYRNMGMSESEVEAAISKEHQARVLRTYLGADDTEIAAIDKANAFARGLRDFFKMKGVVSEEALAAEVYRKISEGEIGRERARRLEGPARPQNQPRTSDLRQPGPEAAPEGETRQKPTEGREREPGADMEGVVEEPQASGRPAAAETVLAQEPVKTQTPKEPKQFAEKILYESDFPKTPGKNARNIGIIDPSGRVIHPYRNRKQTIDELIETVARHSNRIVEGDPTYAAVNEGYVRFNVMSNGAAIMATPKGLKNVVKLMTMSVNPKGRATVEIVDGDRSNVLNGSAAEILKALSSADPKNFSESIKEAAKGMKNANLVVEERAEVEASDQAQERRWWDSRFRPNRPEDMTPEVRLETGLYAQKKRETQSLRPGQYFSSYVDKWGFVSPDGKDIDGRRTRANHHDELAESFYKNDKSVAPYGYWLKALSDGYVRYTQDKHSGEINIVAPLKSAKAARKFIGDNAADETRVVLDVVSGDNTYPIITTAKRAQQILRSLELGGEQFLKENWDRLAHEPELAALKRPLSNEKFLEEMEKSGITRRKDITPKQAAEDLEGPKWESSLDSAAKRDENGNPRETYGEYGDVSRDPAPDTYYSPEAKGLYALRISDNARRRVRETISTPEKEPGLVRGILDKLFPEGTQVPKSTILRYKTLNSREIHGWIDEMLYKKSEQDPSILARLRAERPEELLEAHIASMPAAMTADVSRTISAHSIAEGYPVYEGGRTRVQRDPNNYVSIIEDIGSRARTKEEALELDSTLTFVMAARSGGRAERLLGEKREKLFSEEDMAEADRILAANPWMQETINKVRQQMDRLLDYLVDTNVVERSWADQQKQYGDYLPFFREVENALTGETSALWPETAQANVNVRGPKTLTGNKGRIRSLMETIPVAIQAATSAGMNNVAGLRAIRNLKMLGLAREADNPQEKGVVSVKAGGKLKYFKIDDPVIYDALRYIDSPLGKDNVAGQLVKMLKGASDLLRFGVTRDPRFAVRNAIRDSFQAWVTSLRDVGFKLGMFSAPGKGAVKFLTFQLDKNNPTVKRLEEAGVITGYDYTGGIKIRKQWEDYLTGKFPDLAENPAEKLANGLKKYWDAYSDWVDRSDAVSRSEVYEAAIRAGKSEAQAEFEAREVLNFARHGSSNLVRLLAAAVPFLNAKVQGLDVLYRSLMGKGNVHLPLKKGEAANRFAMRAMTYVMLAGLYHLMMSQYTGYKNATVEERDNNWLLPLNPADPDSVMVRIPTAFELGWFFKAVPERLLSIFRGSDQWKDFEKSVRSFVSGQLGADIRPQIVKPWMEVTAGPGGWDSFRQRQIESTYMQEVLPKYRYDEYTTETGKAIGAVTGEVSDALGPKKIDHLIRGYFGTIGTTALDMIDLLLSKAGAARTRPERSLPRAPLVGGFFQTPYGSGEIIKFNEARQRMRKFEDTVRRLQKVNKPEDAKKLIGEYSDLTKVMPELKRADKAMADLSAQKMQVNMSNMTGEEKRKKLEEIQKLQIQVAREFNRLSGRSGRP